MTSNIKETDIRNEPKNAENGAELDLIFSMIESDTWYGRALILLLIPLAHMAHDMQETRQD